MTEAMSRHEIEDVLSSIRRLVSHDDAAKPQEPEARGSGKLVLTSELRVDTAGTPTSKVAAAQSRPAITPAGKPPPAPLLTRITQAGQRSSDAQPSAFSSPPDDVPQTPPEASPRPEGKSENGLEATLTQLEEALSVTPPGKDSANETLIDEDALAEIVAGLVRQELQGELGERITRNIRKLVRAEVARELQTRNL